VHSRACLADRALHNQRKEKVSAVVRARQAGVDAEEEEEEAVDQVKENLDKQRPRRLCRHEEMPRAQRFSANCKDWNAHRKSNPPRMNCCRVAGRSRFQRAQKLVRPAVLKFEEVLEGGRLCRRTVL
jgi:hypothetical protein